MKMMPLLTCQTATFRGMRYLDMCTVQAGDMFACSAPGVHWCPRGSHVNIWSNFGSIIPNLLNIPKNKLWDALLVDTSILKTYKN